MARCKYGKLKSPHGRRVCRRKSKHGGSQRKMKCRYGKLKSPTGSRKCKRKPHRRGRRHSGSVAAQEAAMWRSYKR